jgi:uncharacterized protein
MPANRFNGYTDYGVGIGLRSSATSMFRLRITTSTQRGYVNSILAERVAQIHLAGHSRFEKYTLDTHDHPVLDPVWRLYARAIERCGPAATLLEWDDNIPSFEEVHGEANRFLLSAESRNVPAEMPQLEEMHV